jgi:hypothetical protein
MSFRTFVDTDSFFIIVGNFVIVNYRYLTYSKWSTKAHVVGLAPAVVYHRRSRGKIEKKIDGNSNT